MHFLFVPLSCKAAFPATSVLLATALPSDGLQPFLQHHVNLQRIRQLNLNIQNNLDLFLVKRRLSGTGCHSSTLD